MDGRAHGDALAASPALATAGRTPASVAAGGTPATAAAAIVSPGPGRRHGDALTCTQLTSPPPPPAPAAPSMPPPAQPAVVLGGAGPGTAPCSGRDAHESVGGGIFPASSFAAHGDPLLAASGLAHPIGQTLDSAPAPEDEGDEVLCRAALRQHECALPPSHDGARHGDPLGEREIFAPNFDPHCTQALPRGSC